MSGGKQMSNLNKFNNKTIVAIILGFFTLLEGSGFVAHRVITTKDVQVLPRSTVAEAAGDIKAINTHLEDLTKEFSSFKKLVEEDLRTGARERRELFERVAGLEAVMRMQDRAN